MSIVFILLFTFLHIETSMQLFQEEFINTEWFNWIIFIGLLTVYITVFILFIVLALLHIEPVMSYFQEELEHTAGVICIYWSISYW